MPSAHRVPAAVVAVAVLAVLPAGAQARKPPKPRDGSAAALVRVKASQSYLDVRGDDRSAASAAQPSLPAATRTAQRSFGRRAGAGAALATDRSTGTVRALQRFGAPLSDRLAGAAAVRGWARDNAALLGLTEDDVDALRAPATRTTRSGITVLEFGQTAAGIPAYDNGLEVVLGADGRVVTAGGSPVRGLGGSATPQVGAAAALRTVADSVGAATVPAVTSTASGARRTTRFAGRDVARLVWFTTGADTRLAWSLVYDAPGADVFHAVVDARSGGLLRRVNLTKYARPARVFDFFPGAQRGGTQRTVDLTPYLDEGATNLSGPFARTFLDLDDDNEPTAAEPPLRDEEVAPGSYAFRRFTPTVGGPCTPFLCAWDPLAIRSWEANANQTAVQAHWYVSNFHDHLEQDPDIAFTDEDGAFAVDDPVVVNANDGASTSSNPTGGLPDADHVDNANMATLPDGESPLMQMYLFNDGSAEDPFRAINGDDDSTTVYHEYTHGLSNRLVTTEDGFGAVSSPQSGAMGEAWSDWYALDYVQDEGFLADTAAPGQVDIGIYSDAEPHATRTGALDCPVSTSAAVVAACPGPQGERGGDAGPGGYTYGDFGRVFVAGPEVHADGEIWAQTLWDLRDALGSNRAQQLITDGMRLSVPEPSFLDMRNAILAADAAANDGANTDAIWTVFAGRGMGYFAAALDGADVEPVEDFSTPPDPADGTGTITGAVTDRDTGAPAAGVRVGVAGHVEALSAQTGADGRYTIDGVPAGTYPKLAFLVGSGYDPAVSTDVAVTRGGTAVADQALRYDWASKYVAAATTTNDDTGAVAGCGVAAVQDQVLGVGWSPYTETAPEAAGNPHQGAPPTVTIELPRAIDVAAFGMDPSANCGDDPSATTKDYTVETSPDGQTFTAAKTGTFAPEDAGRLNEVAPDAGAAGVKFVRLTMSSSQGAGLGDSGSSFRDFSEFAVYGTPTAAAAPPAPTPAAPAPPAPTPPAATPPARPGLTLGTRSRGGKLRFRVRCEATCVVRATLSATRAGARRGKLVQRLLQRRRARLTGRSAPRTLSVQATKRLRKVLKRRGIRRLPVTLTVRVTSKAGNRTATRTLRLRL